MILKGPLILFFKLEVWQCTYLVLPSNIKLLRFVLISITCEDIAG